MFKEEVSKKPKKKDFHPFKKRSKYYEEIKSCIEQIEEISPFRSHDALGINNISGSHWLGGRWFFGVKNEGIEVMKVYTDGEYEVIEYEDGSSIRYIPDRTPRKTEQVNGNQQ
ncbi:hypothetical protein [Bacillus manliponensis]|uniref:hypothetical protein n=1 Tax=Bacillus manliponensis TaxID=574376 RepID=UPI001F2A1A7F|nr:hypothetical protein [Bacillus manliponensis]